ncbi:hypothetical protein J437_LFUL003185 [Ladona fulva]|uniref:Uncharacterized protein n=1 Tax=Ladona fulva TaxID=123851 RepID=A0A8K0JXI5_LADFU|nr:hypothetical protein J437_LFUL003185 [Ladona fulva]
MAVFDDIWRRKDIFQLTSQPGSDGVEKRIKEDKLQAKVWYWSGRNLYTNFMRDQDIQVDGTSTINDTEVDKDINETSYRGGFSGQTFISFNSIRNQDANIPNTFSTMWRVRDSL